MFAFDDAFGLVLSWDRAARRDRDFNEFFLPQWNGKSRAASKPARGHMWRMGDRG